MQKIEIQKYSTKFYLIAALICSLPVLFYLYEFTIRTMPTAMTEELMSYFNITAEGLGILSSAFYMGYAIMQIPVGLLYDKFSARSLLIFAMGLTAFSTLLFGLTKNIYTADIAYFLIGFSGSFAFIGTLVLISKWFPRRYFTTIVGCVQFLSCIGAILGVGPIVVLTNKFGWQVAVFCIASIGFGLFILMILFLRNSPNAKEALSIPKTPKIKMSEWRRLKIITHNPQTWWIGLYGFTSWLPMVVFSGLWGLPFLMTLYGISDEKASWGITILWLGVALGGPFFGWWSNHIHRRCLPAILCSGIGLLSAILIIYVNGISWPFTCAILFFFGVAASGQTLSFGMVHDIQDESVIGTGIGFNNMAVIIGGVFLQPMVGLLLKYNWSGGVLNGAPVYTLQNFRWALFCLPLLTLIGLLTAKFLIKETYCPSPDDESL